MSSQDEAVTVKPNGDLTGAGTTKFHEQLSDAASGASATVLVDLVRPAVMDSRALAVVLMAKKSLEARGRSLQIHLGHSEWAELETVAGLRDIITD